MLAGLALVIISTAMTSVIPWLLRHAIDAMGKAGSAQAVWTVALAIIGTALVAGVMRYQMRHLINGVSRWIEYDLRNDLFLHLETLALLRAHPDRRHHGAAHQ